MDSIYPFSLFNTSQKGRLVILDECARSILRHHNYPALINHYLLELMTLGCILGNDTKTKALITLQITADKSSPISTLVVDLEHEGGMRAYARFDENLLAQFDINTPLQTLFENGHMLLNVDFEKDNNRYQAVVELRGKTLTESMGHYCKQSDQIPSHFNVHIAAVDKGLPKGRLAVGIMLQQLPLKQDALMQDREKALDEWTTALLFLKSLKNTEALAENLTAHKLLYRLFHEAQLEEYSPKEIYKKCRCNQEKIENIIKSFTPQEQQSLVEDGTIAVNCEFCSTIYKINPLTLH
jgi:molecular chaperone Hsp33